MRTAAPREQRLRAEARRKLTATEVTEDCAVTRKCSANATGAWRSKNEEHLPGRCPRIRDPVDGAASHVFAKEEVAVEYGHGLVVVTHRPTSTCVPVVQTGIWCQHELPAAGHSVRELKVLTEGVAVQSFVEAQCFEHLAPVSHVAPGKKLDFLPRSR